MVLEGHEIANGRRPGDRRLEPDVRQFDDFVRPVEQQRGGGGQSIGAGGQQVQHRAPGRPSVDRAADDDAAALVAGGR